MKILRICEGLLEDLSLSLFFKMVVRRGYFIQLPARIDSFKFSFFPTIIKIWNSLPSYLINSPSLNHFCNYLDK